MCGFAGEFLLSRGQASLELADRMAALLAHRGPDEQGHFLSADGRCAIGFRRLAVIDPAASHQPMSLPDGAATVAFNGEIYNFRQLRAELTAAGVRLATQGDTEVLLHLYARYGPDFVRRLSGMFAMAIFDPRRGLLLARDRLGQKPLWYAPLADRIVFASQARSLLQHPTVDGRVSRQSLIYYATVGYVPAPLTAWAGIRKLHPAHTLAADQAVGEPQRYWQPRQAPADATPDELREQVRAGVTRAVAEHMVADVPLGALLSGGLDSSIVVALMAKAAGRAGGVRTFTAGFSHQQFDERPHAAAVARHCGTQHTELLIEPPGPEMLDAVIDAYDEPFADSSAVPTMLICRQARRHVTVALAGDGGDEVFAGYDRYRAMMLAERMRPPTYLAVRLAAAAARGFAPASEKSRLRRLIRFADSLPHPPAQQYLMIRQLFAASDMSSLFTTDFLHDLDPTAAETWFEDLYESPEVQDELTRAQHHDIATYLPDDLLVKTDTASMACSLELRAPLLDHELVDLGLSMPPDLKVSRRRGKVILRQAFADLLPPEILRRGKQGFGVPLGRWLGHELAGPLKETLLDPSMRREGVFQPEAVAGLVNDHNAGREDHSHRLWAMLVLARWLQRQRI